MTERHGHPAVLAANDLHDIARLWPELTERIAAGGGSDSSGFVTGSKVRPLPISAHVIDVITEVEEWVTFLARVLIDETDWTVTNKTTPGLIESIAGRVGHFTEHPDQFLAQSFCDDAQRLRELVQATAHPSGKRTLRIGAPCFEKSTSDLGERIPCPGQYTVLADPERPYVVPDIICDRDRSHRITPVEWQRAYRRTGSADLAADLVGRWRRVDLDEAQGA